MNEQIQQEPKEKKSVFSKWWFWVIAVVLIITAIVIFFISSLVKKGKDFFDNNKIIDNAINQIDDIDSGEDNDGTSTNDSTSTSEEEYVSRDSLDIPSVFPEYSDGDIAKQTFSSTWNTEGAPNIITVGNTSQTAIEEYVQNAIEEGWEMDWENEQMGDEDASWALHIESGGKTYNIALNWYGVTEDLLTIVMTEK
jgi:hypothetical protein